jgi:hypothetical protein
MVEIVSRMGHGRLQSRSYNGYVVVRIPQFLGPGQVGLRATIVVLARPECADAVRGYGSIEMTLQVTPENLS